jgi:small subunit ribosomal protein S11
MRKRKKQFKKRVPELPNRFVYIKSTFNNTFINLADKAKNTLFCLSSGCLGFKGAKKKSPFAAQAISEKIISLAHEKGITNITIIVKGVGIGREAAIQTFKKSGIKISQIKDKTPISHNGCRPPLKRRK